MGLAINLAQNPILQSKNFHRDLLRCYKHPLSIICRKIGQFFNENLSADMPLLIDNSCFSTVRKSFDQLLFDAKHPARRPSDTYFVTKDFLLRSQMTSNEIDYFSKGYSKALIVGKVFRRDEIDKTHFPIFHQMEGVYAKENSEWGAEPVASCLSNLKQIFELLIKNLFGTSIQYRWNDDFFPYTNPSLELEIMFKDKWVEVLGCGILHPEIVSFGPLKDATAWAFGLGLERIAMILYEINDIRVFWNDSQNFLDQFSYDAGNVKFHSGLVHDPIVRDISFWVQSESFEENTLFDYLRTHTGDLLENVSLIDSFVHPQTNRQSRCYRLLYRSVDRPLSSDEVDRCHSELRKNLEAELSVALR